MKTMLRLKLLTQDQHREDLCDACVRFDNASDPLEHREAISRAIRIELDFPVFTDGRAYSQAYLIRRRLGFTGDLRATGEVLVDQVMQMERMGFSSAVLARQVDAAEIERQLERFPAFYQADALHVAPFRS